MHKLDKIIISNFQSAMFLLGGVVLMLLTLIAIGINADDLLSTGAMFFCP
jgi:hypothetical protein